MFDIGFFELVLISVIALMVLGPERLPGAIRTVTLWLGRLRRSFNTIKQDIEREIGADEIRRQLRNEEIMERFRHTQSQVKNTISDVQKKTEEFKKNIELESQVAAITGKENPAEGKDTPAEESGRSDKPAKSHAEAAATSQAWADTSTSDNPPEEMPASPSGNNVKGVTGEGDA